MKIVPNRFEEAISLVLLLLRPLRHLRPPLSLPRPLKLTIQPVTLHLDYLWRKRRKRAKTVSGTPSNPVDDRRSKSSRLHRHTVPSIVTPQFHIHTHLLPSFKPRIRTLLPLPLRLLPLLLLSHSDHCDIHRLIHQSFLKIRSLPPKMARKREGGGLWPRALR
jgi:hypothetical protein